MLQTFGEEIWTVGGPTLAIAGFPYPTRMVVIRLTDGGLFVWSPVALTEPLQHAIDRLGPVRHIIAPNGLHHLYVGAWQDAYPAAKTHGVAHLRTKRPDLRWDGDLGDTPAAAWAPDIDQVLIPGTRSTTEAVFFHRASRTAIFTDLIQHFEPGWVTGWRALAARLDLLTAPEPAVPRKFRLMMSDRRAARAAVLRILEWPTEKLLAAHCPPLTQNGRDVIARAFAWLVRR